MSGVRKGFTLRGRSRRVAAAVAAAAVVTSGSLAPIGASTPTHPALAAHAPSGGLSDFYVLLRQGAEIDPTRAAVEAMGGTVEAANERVGLLRVEAPQEDFVEAITSVPDVELAEYTSTVMTSRRPERVPAIGEQPEPPSVRPDRAGPRDQDPLDSRLWGKSMIGADRAQGTGRGVTVGVIDSGVDASHPDIVPNYSHELSRDFTRDCPEEGCVTGADRDRIGHGTHVAGTIAAAANGMGVSGVAPEATIVSLRVMRRDDDLDLLSLVNALVYAGDHGIDVVNMSLGSEWFDGCDGSPTLSPPSRQLYHAALDRALGHAHSHGTTLVASTGNDFQDLTARPRSSLPIPTLETMPNFGCHVLPGLGDHVIAVTAVGPSGGKAGYANYGVPSRPRGPMLIAAPGGDSQAMENTGLSDQIGKVLSTLPPASVRRSSDGNVDPQWSERAVRACDVAGRVCGYYGYESGTSMAAPHVAGAVALVIAAAGVPDPHRPGELMGSPDLVRDVLATGARQVG